MCIALIGNGPLAAGVVENHPSRNLEIPPQRRGGTRSVTGWLILQDLAYFKIYAEGGESFPFMARPRPSGCALLNFNDPPPSVKIVAVTYIGEISASNIPREARRVTMSPSR